MNKTKNTLNDLNNILFEQLERLNDTELSEEELSSEIERSKSITSVAGSIISNANLALQAVKHADSYGYDTHGHLPQMLEDRNDG